MRSFNQIFKTMPSFNEFKQSLSYKRLTEKIRNSKNGKQKDVDSKRSFLDDKVYKPSVFLTHPFAQSVYNITQPLITLPYVREKIFFEDGGHISLDWSYCIKSQKGKQIEYSPPLNTPIFFVMHGLTGGSEMNYIKVLINEARRSGFRSVCMNSRGICNQMTSPLPFTGLDFEQLDAALDLIENRYPDVPIFMVGASFGANYLTRYLLQKPKRNIKGYVALATPFDVNAVVSDMLPIYQKFFVKRYIYETVQKHYHMRFWEDIGRVNMKEVLASKNLFEFHDRLTVKIVKLNNVHELFERFSIRDEIQNLQIPSLFLNSKDDPIVSSKAIPYEGIRKNKHLKFIQTETGGHVCWYEGIVPKRWYPKPTIEFFNKLSTQL